MEQSPSSGTTPSDVPVDHVVQPTSTGAPTSDQSLEFVRKMQSERDRYAAELERKDRELALVNDRLNSRLTVDERERETLNRQKVILEDQLNQTKQELDNVRSSQVRQQLISSEFPELSHLESVKNITGTEEEQRATMQYIKKELDAYVKARDTASAGKDSAEPNSPAIENVSVTESQMSPEEFDKLPLEKQKTFLERLLK